MGNNSSSSSIASPLKQWSQDNVQSFHIKGHKNKIFGCDVVVANRYNANELWIASCSADGRLLIHEVLIETSSEKLERQKILHSHQKKTHCLSKSKSLSSIQRATASSTTLHDHKRKSNPSLQKAKNLKPKAFEIEINRLLSIPLDSTYCYTLSLHPNCRYVSTCVDCTLFVFEIDFNSESPVHHQIKIAQKYISAAKFINEKHIIFASGDGNVYLYNFIEKKLVCTISYDEHSEKRDILCMDHTVLRLSHGRANRQIIAFAAEDGNILIYDMTEVVEHDLNDQEKENQQTLMNGTQSECRLLQRMSAQFGAEISCISMSQHGEFLVVGADDNTYNIYCISLKYDGDTMQFEWVLLHKQIVANDANIARVSWINNNSMIATCDKGQQLYMSGMYDVRDCELLIGLLGQSIHGGLDKKVRNLYDTKDNELHHIISHLVDIVLEYVRWYVLPHEMSVDFDDKISCIASSASVNNGAGFVVVGGFSKLLQCFLPLQ